MKFLLDTHLLIWAAVSEGIDRTMPAEACALVDDLTNDLYFSAASIWEVAIKFGKGRGDFPVDPHVLRRALNDEQYIELGVTSAHGAATAQLPPIHGDPFDRLLVAQATIEGLTLLTADKRLAEYPGPIRLIGR